MALKKHKYTIIGLPPPPHYMNIWLKIDWLLFIIFDIRDYLLLLYPFMLWIAWLPIITFSIYYMVNLFIFIYATSIYIYILWLPIITISIYYMVNLFIFIFVASISMYICYGLPGFQSLHSLSTIWQIDIYLSMLLLYLSILLCIKNDFDTTFYEC